MSGVVPLPCSDGVRGRRIRTPAARPGPARAAGALVLGAWLLLSAGSSAMPSAADGTRAVAAESPSSGMPADAVEPRPGRSRSERDLEDRVLVRLADEAALAGSDLDVRADGDRVLLSGSVPTDTARDYAARVVGSTPGVRAVESRLELGTPREIVSITDDDLASDVTYLLGLEFEGVEAGDDPIVGWRVDGGAWEFLVGVEDREVTLDGSVPDAHEVRRAVETAWRVPGVRRVRAELELVGDRVSPPTYVGGESAEADLGAVR